MTWAQRAGTRARAKNALTDCAPRAAPDKLHGSTLCTNAPKRACAQIRHCPLHRSAIQAKDGPSNEDLFPTQQVGDNVPQLIIQTDRGRALTRLSCIRASKLAPYAPATNRAHISVQLLCQPAKLRQGCGVRRARRETLTKYQSRPQDCHSGACISNQINKQQRRTP